MCLWLQSVCFFPTADIPVGFHLARPPAMQCMTGAHLRGSGWLKLQQHSLFMLQVWTVMENKASLWLCCFVCFIPLFSGIHCREGEIDSRRWFYKGIVTLSWLRCHQSLNIPLFFVSASARRHFFLLFFFLFVKFNLCVMRLVSVLYSPKESITVTSENLYNVVLLTIARCYTPAAK